MTKPNPMSNTAGTVDVGLFILAMGITGAGGLVLGFIAGVMVMLL